MSAAAAPQFGSQTEFARANGWNKSYVSKLKGEDRIVFAADGQVDFAASLARIKATTGAPERAAEPVQGIVYSDAQERDRHYAAELKRVELEKVLRTLLPADEVHSAVADAAAIVRSGVEAWRDRLPPQLAAIGGDEARIAALLAGECQALLERLSERFNQLLAAA